MTGYDDVEYVLAEIITEATGEPRVGRLERTLAKSALARLRGMGLVLPTPPANDVREALDADVTAPWPNSMHQVWERLVEFSEVYRRERGYPPNEAARTRFLFAAFDVRPRGTVTDAECVDIANRAQMVTGRSIWPSTVRAVLEAAREVRP